MPDDREFRAVGVDDAAASEEVLEVGRRRVSRWFWATAAAAVAVIVASVAVAQSGSQHHRAGPQRSVDSRPTPHVQVPAAVRDPLHVGTDEVLDAVGFAQHTWLLQPRRLIGLSIAAGRDRTAPVPPLGSSASYGSPRLVLDRSAAQLWVVLEGARHGRALEYDLWTLHRVRDVQLPAISSAAAMDGHLYLTARRQLVDVPPRGAVHARRIHGIVGSLGPIAADPARSRLLVLDYSRQTHIWIYQPDRNQLRLAAALPFTKASIAITARAVWVGGFARSGAALWQLDVRSLRPRGMSPLSADLGPGAILLPGGADDVWVSSGGGPGLWCVDGQTGVAEQNWPLAPTAVTANRRRAIVVSAGQAVALQLRGGCAG
jgi:hypothetical protein